MFSQKKSKPAYCTIQCLTTASSRCIDEVYNLNSLEDLTDQSYVVFIRKYWIELNLEAREGKMFGAIAHYFTRQGYNVQFIYYEH